MSKRYFRACLNCGHITHHLFMAQCPKCGYSLTKPAEDKSDPPTKEEFEAQWEEHLKELETFKSAFKQESKQP